MRNILKRIEKLENKTSNKDGKFGLVPIYKFSSLSNAATAFNNFRGTDFSSEDLSHWNEHIDLRGKKWLWHPKFNISAIVLERKRRLSAERGIVSCEV